MKPADAAFGVARHAIAGVCSTVFVAAVPILLYAALAALSGILYGDTGGPMNVFLVPMISFLLAASATLLLYAPLSLGCELLRGRLRLPLWLPPLAAPPVLFLLFLAWGLLAEQTPGPLALLGVAGALSIFLSAGFCVYWVTLLTSGALIRFFRGNRALRRAARRTATWIRALHSGEGAPGGAARRTTTPPAKNV